FSRWFEDSSYVFAKFGVSNTSRSGLEFVYPISESASTTLGIKVCTDVATQELRDMSCLIGAGDVDFRTSPTPSVSSD
ncbi:hypothetical protein J6590_102808, partial [Homalodisca vitripennis]